MNKKTEFEEQYDKIYLYCYFKLHKREAAEDITQETFLRYLEHYADHGREWDLRYLYRIAHNLCVDEFRKPVVESLLSENTEDRAGKEWAVVKQRSEKTLDDNYTEQTITTLWLRNALNKLSQEEQEILLLRYANEVPNNVISHMLGISRFALYRKMKQALRKLQKELGEETN